MRDQPKSPRFLASFVRGRHCLRSRQPGIVCRRGTAGDDLAPSQDAWHLLRTPISRRGAAARRRLHRITYVRTPGG